MQESLGNIINDNFLQNIATVTKAQHDLVGPLMLAVEAIIKAIQKGNKLLICGNGGSAADAQHFAAEFTGRYEIERDPLPAIALTTDTSAITAISNDYGFEEIYVKQIQALAIPDDILIAISTSGNSRNIIKAIQIAQIKKVKVIALTGRSGGIIANLLTNSDINICVPATRTARIQEVHGLVLHTICDAIDKTLYKAS